MLVRLQGCAPDTLAERVAAKLIVDANKQSLAHVYGQLDMLDKGVDSGPCAWQTFRKTWALINIPPAGARNSPT